MNANKLRLQNNALNKQLEKLMEVQKQLFEENSKIKAENQVLTKQVSIRNERIITLEEMFQESQKRINALR